MTITICLDDHDHLGSFFYICMHHFHVIHHRIQIDTGMSRLGFPVAKESVEEILKIGRLVYTDCEGMFTHFSKADETDTVHR